MVPIYLTVSVYYFLLLMLAAQLTALHFPAAAEAPYKSVGVARLILAFFTITQVIYLQLLLKFYYCLFFMSSDQ